MIALHALSRRYFCRSVADIYGKPFSFETEIGHEKAQSVIDSITSSYAAEGQAHANPMLPHNQPGQNFPPPFPFPGGKFSLLLLAEKRVVLNAWRG
jgi:hypothetical protein